MWKSNLTVCEIHHYSLSFFSNYLITGFHFPSSSAEWTVLTCRGLSGIVIVVDEIWAEHLRNEKSACYGAIMVYGRLDACPMGLLSSRPYTLLRFSLSNPLSDCFHPRQAYSGNPTNYVHDWWREKSEKVKDREGQKKEEERAKKERGPDLKENWLSCFCVWIGCFHGNHCNQNHTQENAHLVIGIRFDVGYCMHIYLFVRTAVRIQ